MTARAKAEDALALRLDANGYAHSVAVAETAAGLAAVYGVDGDAAYLAGLLHDWRVAMRPRLSWPRRLASAWK